MCHECGEASSYDRALCDQGQTDEARLLVRSFERILTQKISTNHNLCL